MVSKKGYSGNCTPINFYSSQQCRTNDHMVGGFWHDTWLCCGMQLEVPFGLSPLPFACVYSSIKILKLANQPTSC